MRPQFVLHESETGALLSDVRALRGIIDAVPHPIFVKDIECRFLIVNRAFCTMMGKTIDELIGKDDYAFFPKDQADVFRGMDRRVFETGETTENEEYFTDGKGTLRTILTGKSRLVLSDGSPLLIGCITDITDFRRAEGMIRDLADRDYLTGLPNRRAFSDRMATAISVANQSAATYSVPLVDLDSFKPINDAHGHSAGDLVLCEVARRLKDVVRETDIVARLGGDEFAVITQVHEPSGLVVEALAQRLLAALREPIVTPDGIVNISASVGMAFSPLDGASPDAVLHAADKAMYRAKHEGRGIYRIYDPSMDRRAEAGLAIEGTEEAAPKNTLAR